MLANAASEKLFGYSKQELPNQFIEMLVPGRFRDDIPAIAPNSTHPASARWALIGNFTLSARMGPRCLVEIGLNPIRRPKAPLSSPPSSTSRPSRPQAEIVRTQRLAALGEMAHCRPRGQESAAAISGPLQIRPDDLQAGDPTRSR